MLQFALGITVMCSENYYHGEAMMMSFHVSVQRGVHMCRVLFAPSCRLTAAPSHLSTGVSWLFRMQMCHIVSHQVATSFPPPHQHQAHYETQTTLKSRSSLSGSGAVVVSLLPEERWDICSLSRFFILFFWQNLPFCLLNIKH